MNRDRDNSDNIDIGGSNKFLSEFLYQMMFVPKPFGILWKFEKMEEFLKFKGYRIVERTNENGDTFTVAVKPNSSYIPNESKSNIVDVFEEEVQSTLLNWLKNISI